MCPSYQKYSRHYFLVLMKYSKKVHVAIGQQCRRSHHGFVKLQWETKLSFFTGCEHFHWSWRIWRKVARVDKQVKNEQGRDKLNKHINSSFITLYFVRPMLLLLTPSIVRLKGCYRRMETLVELNSLQECFLYAMYALISKVSIL